MNDILLGLLNGVRTVMTPVSWLFSLVYFQLCDSMLVFFAFFIAFDMGDPYAFIMQYRTQCDDQFKYYNQW
jgi:hypothetical protein